MGGSRWEGPSSTTRSFNADDVLFIEENPYGDFSSAAWEGATLSTALIDVLSWLDTSFMSSSTQCYILEGFYERCLTLVRLAYGSICRGDNLLNLFAESDVSFDLTIVFLYRPACPSCNTTACAPYANITGGRWRRLAEQLRVLPDYY